MIQVCNVSLGKDMKVDIRFVQFYKFIERFHLIY